MRTGDNRHGRGRQSRDARGWALWRPCSGARSCGPCGRDSDRHFEHELMARARIGGCRLCARKILRAEFVRELSGTLSELPRNSAWRWECEIELKYLTKSRAITQRSPSFCVGAATEGSIVA